MYCNVQSIVNKVNQLEAKLVSKDVDIVAITETHLDDSVDSLELFSNTYTIFRKYRNRRGGGVLIAVKNNI